MSDQIMFNNIKSEHFWSQANHYEKAKNGGGASGSVWPTAENREEVGTASGHSRNDLNPDKYGVKHNTNSDMPASSNSGWS